MNREEMTRNALHLERKVTAAEVYAVRCVTQKMKKENVKEGSLYWKAVTERTTEILMNHREEVRRMYLDSKHILKEYIIKQSGADDYAAFTKMLRMGLTGDIEQDMKILQEVNRR